MRLSLSRVLILAMVSVFVMASILTFTEFWRPHDLVVPDVYYQFLIDHAPYLYYNPGTGPDVTHGKATLAAAFAIDFLYEAYDDPQFTSNQTEIANKIAELADFIVTQQNTNPAKEAYGGFISTETSTSYYAIDACRAIPSLIKAFKLTETTGYLDAAKLAGATFLYNLQHPPTPSVHDQYYGGFARAVDINDSWLPEMDIENLYGLIGLQMLATEDPSNQTRYQTMMAELIGFLRSGFEGFWLEYRPAPSGDGQWHRVGLSDNEIYDDAFAYALLGLYDYEGWTLAVQNVYDFINAINASAQYAAYNPAICWAGYLDVVNRVAACDYYDAVTSGILWKLRKHHDKSSFEFSMKIIDQHQDAFMFWGVKFTDYSYKENKQATATVAWLSRLYLNYEDPITRFTQILRSKGENVILYPVCGGAETVSYGEAVDIQAVVNPASIQETIVEAGYIVTDYLILYVFAPIRHHDRIRRNGVDYEVLGPQDFRFHGDIAHRKATLRRLLSA